MRKHIARRLRPLLRLCLLGAGVLAGTANAQPGVLCETITLRSGQVAGAPGSPGQTDSLVRRHPTTVPSAPISGVAFDAAWFAAADVGPLARVTAQNSGWVSLSCDSQSQARWISHTFPSQGNGASAFYAVPFMVDTDCIQAAELDICWLADDRLGDFSGGPNTAGAYLNGVPLGTVSGGGIGAVTSVTGLNITALLNSGPNSLYLYTRNTGTADSGLNFIATIRIYCCPPPLPCWTVDIRSGQVGGVPGVPGQLDSAVRRHPTTVPSGQLSSVPFNAAWFAAAQSGVAARVTAQNPGWTSLSCDPEGRSRWISHAFPSQGNGRSAFYAVPFAIDVDCIDTARLEFCWLADETLGDVSGGPNPAGVYINGVPTSISGGNFSSVSTQSIDISAMVTPGVNWMYIYTRNIGISDSGLNFFARVLVTCCNPATGCVNPPRNMVGWLPFDEPGGSITDNTMHASADGVLSGGAWLGTPGVVGNAVCFDEGRVDVPHYPALALNNDITIDAWVKIIPQGGPWTHTIVDKRQFCGLTWRGYWLYVSQPSGVLTLEFNDCGAVRTSFGPVIPFSTWQYIAVSVRRNCGGPGNVCVNFRHNSLCGPGTPGTFTGVTGGTGTIAGFRVGDDMAGAQGNWLLGCVDELEIFDRALSCAETQSIYEAGEHGKCKEFCVAEWDRSFYGNQQSITVPLRLCNSTSAVQCYSLQIFPATCPISTGTPSPSGITVAPIPPVCVAPGTCSTVWLTIPRPPFAAIGDVSCYTVCMTNLATGLSECCDGSVQWAQDVISIQWPPIRRGDVVIDVGVDFGPVVVGPGGSGSLAAPIRFRAVGPDMQDDLRTVSLNGLPPGEPVIWFAKAPAGGVDELPMIVRFVENDANQPYWVLMEMDLDGDGDLEPVESVSLLGRLADPCEPVENEDFEFHPPGTVCGIEGFIPWQNGNDVCGVVSTERAFSGNRSLKIVGAVGGAGGLGDDTVLPVSGVESGRWTFRCMTFVPLGATGDGAIVLLNTYDDVAPPQNSWYSAQVRLRSGSNLVTADFGAGSTTMIKGQWVELRIEIDLDNDLADYFYNGVQFVNDRRWSDGVVQGFPGPTRLRAIDFYGGEPFADGISAMFIDDVTIKAPCDLFGGADCNQNGVDDAVDIAKGTSSDCYNAALGSGNSPDGVPDECQCIADWNLDGTVNSTDVSDFINTFFSDQSSGISAGDINCDGVSNSTDVSDFINLWFGAQGGQLPFAGCSI